MNILQQKYPNEKHVFVFDNAHTHSKCAEDALSAVHMPHNPQEWGITVPLHDSSGKIIYLPNGKPLMTIKHMANTTFNGSQQHLYFPDNDPIHPGKFNRMAQILREHGYTVDSPYLQAECPLSSSCQSKAQNNCCCQNILLQQLS